MRDRASIAEETSSWPDRHDLDLTGFIDGTENPTLIDAPGVALVPEGTLGADGTILLLQKWEHDATAWESLAG
jgi:porphyrinogen peroxidase